MCQLLLAPLMDPCRIMIVKGYELTHGPVCTGPAETYVQEVLKSCGSYGLPFALMFGLLPRGRGMLRRSSRQLLPVLGHATSQGLIALVMDEPPGQFDFTVVSAMGVNASSCERQSNLITRCSLLPALVNLACGSSCCTASLQVNSSWAVARSSPKVPRARRWSGPGSETGALVDMSGAYTRPHCHHGL